MKTLIRTLKITVFTLSLLVAQNLKASADSMKIFRNKYPHQITVSIGVPLTNDPITWIGLTANAGYRYKHHVMGITALRKFDLSLFSNTHQSIKTNVVYYGVSWSNNWLNFYPTIGLGFMETNRHGEYNSGSGWFGFDGEYTDIKWTGFCLEPSINCQITGRGNGIGIRAFHNFNGYMDYSGVSVSLVFGHNW